MGSFSSLQKTNRRKNIERVNQIATSSLNVLYIRCNRQRTFFLGILEDLRRHRSVYLSHRIKYFSLSMDTKSVCRFPKLFPSKNDEKTFEKGTQPIYVVATLKPSKIFFLGILEDLRRHQSVYLNHRVKNFSLSMDTKSLCRFPKLFSSKNDEKTFEKGTQPIYVVATLNINENLFLGILEDLRRHQSTFLNHRIKNFSLSMDTKSLCRFPKLFSSKNDEKTFQKGTQPIYVVATLKPSKIFFLGVLEDLRRHQSVYLNHRIKYFSLSIDTKSLCRFSKLFPSKNDEKTFEKGTQPIYVVATLKI